MSVINQYKCDICGKIFSSEEKGWKILRNFCYIKHACSKCVDATDNYGGSHLHETRLECKVRANWPNRREPC